MNKKVVIAWVPSHIGIKGNGKADKFAKQALNFNVLDLKVLFTDLKVNASSVFKTKVASSMAESYMLKGEDMPRCIPCHCPETVKHILLECIDLHDTRIKYYRDGK